MSVVNQTPNVLPLQPVSGMTQTQKATWHRTVLAVAAWVEILVGCSFILVPETQSQFVFGVTVEGAGIHFARFSGVALIGLGIACLPSKFSDSNSVAVRSLFLFNIAATIFFALVGVAATSRGVLLWPVVILHAVIAAALAPSLQRASE